MYYSDYPYGYSQGYMCPYCGGMHPAGQCPMMMYPPAKPPKFHPPMPGMDQMMEMMMKHQKLLEQIKKCCEEVNFLVKDIHSKLAKG
ncbi:MAG: hypothetical protein CVU89_01690 [Firmicutes bacterium HGW-Firmicutes-14]|nr:MAG: hypothetical protein CVU89_01690 [Firmicutes bacterium HGW-Firmicutes-14]